jgi:hypothetical protein
MHSQQCTAEVRERELCLHMRGTNGLPLCDNSRLWIAVREVRNSYHLTSPHLVIDRPERDRAFTCPRALALTAIKVREPCRVLIAMPRCYGKSSRASSCRRPCSVLICGVIVPQARLIVPFVDSS